MVSGADLAKSTPAEGWSIGDTIGHLWYFDREATKALVAPDEFHAGMQALFADPIAAMDHHLAEARELGDELPAVWQRTRAELLDALTAADPSAKVPWYGPPMAPASFATARLMEYWAHGQDVADALGVRREPTARLRHICHLGVRTRGFSYVVHGREAPQSDVFVALSGPGGERWTWGDESAPNRVEGDAAEFCLVVTQRRHVDDTGLRVTGEDAREWMSIAQAFAGAGTITHPDRRGLPTG
jgi:uncharacterized protein (TIGR03084 family)